MPGEALQTFDPSTASYVVPVVVLIGFYLHHRAQKFAGLR